MKRFFPPVICLLAVLAILFPAHAAELKVDPVAGPYKTIASAIAAAAAGDTVTVTTGTYREAVTLKSGLPGQPFTLRAAPGAAAVVTAFDPVQNWRPWKGEIYTTSVTWAARDLYVDYKLQRIARNPACDRPWHRLAASAGALITATTATVVAGVTGGSPYLFGFNSSGDWEVNLPAVSSDAAAHTFTLALPNTSSGLLTGNRFILCNHRDLIGRPGEWAYEVNGGGTILYFWPPNAADLPRTQSSRNRTPVAMNNVANVSVEGLEVAGGYNGIAIQGGSREVTVTGCVVHDVNGGTGNTWGTGILVRTGAAVTIRRCRSVRNHMGISVTGAHQVTVEECEIAFNREDGMRVTGDPRQARTEMRLADGVVVRRNYIHHQNYLGHPDDFQIFSGVRRLRVEDNLETFGGQGLMTQECSVDNVVRGNVFFGISACIFQTHTDSLDWSFENNLFGFGGWGALSMSGSNSRVYENIIYKNPLAVNLLYQGDRNVIYPVSGNAVTATEWGVYKKGYSTLAAYSAASGQELNSRQGDPLLRNVPLDQGFALDIDNPNTTSATLRVRAQPSLTSAVVPFAPGDLLELNGDGVARRVTAVTGDLVSFDPPAPVRPFREGHCIVWRWGTQTDFQLDTRPDPAGPAGALSARGGAIGSAIDVKAYQAGDFNGDGARELPPVPVLLQAAWPDPNNPIIPGWSPL